MNDSYEIKISVVIPCYNCPGNLVNAAVESVFRQTFSNYEILIVDDGSEPPYHQALEEIASAHEKIRLLTVPHGGVSAARNTGTLQARGEYITYMDADDALTRDFFRHAYQAATETGADCVVGAVLYTKTRNRELTYCSKGTRERIVYEDGDVEKFAIHILGINDMLKFDEGHVNRGSVARLIKRELARQNPFDKTLILCEDVIWNLSLLKRCRKICVVRERWYLYWKNPSSALHKYNPNVVIQLRAFIEELEKHLDLQKDKIYVSFADRIRENMFWIKDSYLDYLKNADRENYKAQLEVLYNDYPWNILAEQRLFKLTNRKWRMYILAYRAHMFFELLSLIKIKNQCKDLLKSSPE